jgi:hypothetical protein
MQAAVNRAALRPDPTFHIMMGEHPQPARPAPEARGLTREEIRQIVLDILG